VNIRARRRGVARPENRLRVRQRQPDEERLPALRERLRDRGKLALIGGAGLSPYRHTATAAGSRLTRDRARLSLPTLAREREA